VLASTEDLELNVNLVEPVITAVTRDRLDSIPALEFAASLIPRTSIKVRRLCIPPNSETDSFV
jgi:hypothetical protein